MRRKNLTTFFVGRVTDAEYPLWGLVVGVVLFGVVVVGLRWRRIPHSGDAGIVLLGYAFSVEWGPE